MPHFDRAAGLLDRAAFSSKSLYQDEQRRIFRRCWLFVGPENWVETPGEYFTTSMGETPVICWRTPAGARLVFTNRCPAGDGLLASRDRGSAEELACSCHGFRYGADGVAVDHPHLSVSRVAQVEGRHGLLFACFDPKAVPLASQLGDFAWYLDMLIGRRAGGVGAVGGAAFRWMVEANWKVAAEAFAGGAYSDLTMHAATHAATGHQPPSTAEQGLQISAGAGALAVLTDASLCAPPAVVRDYEQSIAAETEARLGADRARSLVPLAGTIFPNLSFDWRTRSLHVWQPRGTALTEINTYCFVDRAAPDEVKDAMRKACQLHFGPAGLQAQDQVGPWTSLTKRANQLLAARFPLNLQMGLGHELKRNLPGRISGLFSEMNQRSFYAWWEDRLAEDEDVPAVSAKMQIAPPRDGG